MRTSLALALASFAMLAPAAFAQDEAACPDGQVSTPEGCSQQAWMDDCPPDHMCAAGNPGNPDNGTVDGSSDCMDGQQGNETCRDDVMYFGGGPADSGPADPAADPAADPSRGPADGSCDNCRGDGAAHPDTADAKGAPAGGALLGVAVVGAAAVARRRQA